MDKAVVCFLVGMIVGAFLLTVALYDSSGLGKNASDVIKECEAKLPRNEYCELKAEPINE